MLPGSPFNGKDGELDSNSSIGEHADVGTPDTFAGGVKEDTDCPPMDGGGAPDKADIVKAWVGNENGVVSGANHTFLYLAWSRPADEGTATIDFELNSGTVSCGVGSKFVKRVADVDLLFEYDFQGGNTIGVSVRTWKTTNQGGEWSAPTEIQPTEAEASISGDQLFGELVVDMTEAGFFQPGVCKAFSSATVKSRASSASFENQVKDLILPFPVDVTNCGSLTVSKTVVGGTLSDSFEFTVDCGEFDVNGEADGDDATFSLANGDFEKFDDIPLGTECSVAETDPDGTLWSTSHKVGNGSPQSGLGVSGIEIVLGNKAVAFTNTRLRGDLVITKTADAPGSFYFDIDCSDDSFDDEGVQVVPGTPYGVSGIPTGTTCTVTEDDNEFFSSVVVPENGHVEIELGDNVVAFTNTRLTGNLVITKSSDVPGSFTFDIDCSVDSFDASDVPIAAGDRHRVTGIPTGTTCTVTEDENDLFESVVVPSDGERVIGLGDNTVAFANSRLRGDLVITKASDQPGTFLFNINCSDDDYDRSSIPIVPGTPYVLEDIPTTTSCTVTEQDNPWFNSSVIPGDGTVIIETGLNSVAFTNTAKPNGISIDKKVNGEDTSSEDPLGVEVGSALNYEVVISNSGQVPLSISDLEDSMNADLADSCGPDVVTQLAPDDSITCTYTMTAVDPGGASIIHNTATVTGVDIFDRPAGPEDDETFVHVLNPKVDLDKTGPAAAHVGDTITYTLTVTNAGNTPLLITDWIDPVCSADPVLKTKQGDDDWLDVDEEWVYECSHVVVAGDPDQLVNTATVIAVDKLETDVDDTDDAVTNILRPAIAITKTGTTSAHIGDAVVYTLVVTNPGNTPLASVTVSDPKCDGLPVRSTVDADGRLSPGESWTYNCTHIVTAVDGKSILNTAKAEGTDPLGQTVNNTANHTAAVLHPAISIVKTASPESISVSGTVTYTYVVTNTGDTTLFNVLVTDDILGAIGRVGELAPGESVTMAKTVDVDALTPPRNIGTAVGTDALGQTVTANDDAVIMVVLGAVLAQPELPRTGAPLQAQAWGALAMIQVGLVLTLTCRRRRVRRAD